MNAVRRQFVFPNGDVVRGDDYICPVCNGDLQYWAAHDVLLCPNCEDEAYDPDTGEVQGPIE